MSTEGNDRKNEMARTAAFAFADALASVYRAQLSERLIGAYLIGSIAHGGFSHRYSDIDLALVTEDGLDTAALTKLRALAAEQDAALSQKLSVFWADRHFSIGRLPPLDRADYLDYAIVIAERERIRPARPTLDEIRAYLKGAPFLNWTENTDRFAKMDVLAPSDHKAFIRTLLYPARLVYSWSTGRMARMTRRWRSPRNIDCRAWTPTFSRKPWRTAKPAPIPMRCSRHERTCAIKSNPASDSWPARIDIFVIDLR
jgi:predicted nucleotidyltransferase